MAPYIRSLKRGLSGSSGALQIHPLIRACDEDSRQQKKQQKEEEDDEWSGAEDARLVPGEGGTRRESRRGSSRGLLAAFTSSSSREPILPDDNESGEGSLGQEDGRVVGKGAGGKGDDPAAPNSTEEQGGESLPGQKKEEGSGNGEEKHGGVAGGAVAREGPGEGDVSQEGVQMVGQEHREMEERQGEDTAITPLLRTRNNNNSSSSSSSIRGEKNLHTEGGGSSQHDGSKRLLLPPFSEQDEEQQAGQAQAAPAATTPRTAPSTPAMAADNNSIKQQEKKRRLPLLASSAVIMVGKIPQRMMKQRRRLLVDLMWAEKLWLLVDLLQMYALLWQLSQPWPWPHFWLVYTRWTLAFNGDVMGLLSEGSTLGRTGLGQTISVGGQLNNYMLYACLWGCVPLLLGGLWLGGSVMQSDKAVLTCWGAHEFFIRRVQVPLAMALLLVSNLLALPIGLGILRLWVCSEGTGSDGDDQGMASMGGGSGWYLDADPSQACWTGGHWCVTLVLTAIFLSFVSVLVRTNYRTANQLVTFDKGHLDHELSLQLLELEFLLEVGDNWLYEKAWLVTSFRRGALHTHNGMLVTKLVLLLVYLSLKGSPRLQAVLFWAILTAWLGLAVLRPPYRCLSSNIVYVVTAVQLIVTMFLAMLTGYRARSSVLVASTQYQWLCVVNGCGFFSLVLYLFWHAWAAVQGHSYARWPTLTTLENVIRSPHKMAWISSLRAARQVLQVCAVRPRELVPIHDVEEQMARVRECWKAAKEEESILEWVLRETLEDLARTHTDYQQGSLLPGRLGLVAAQLDDHRTRQAMKRRAVGTVLSSRRQRVLLLKLLAVGAFLKRIKHRRTPISKGMVQHMRVETERLLKPPVQLERQAAMTGLCKQWKRVIRKWEADFRKEHGRLPESHDKERECSEWYLCYRRLHMALDSIRSAIVDPLSTARMMTAAGQRRGSFERGGGGGGGGGGGVRRRSSASSGSSNDLAAVRRNVEQEQRAFAQALVDLTLTTEALLSSGGASVEFMEEVTACRKEWKNHIKRWEGDFLRTFGKAPQLSDKKGVASWYENNQRLKALALLVKGGGGPFSEV